jgi:hypothetical protein
MVGYDSYYFLQKEGVKDEGIGSFMLSYWVQGNILIAKCLLFVALFVSCLLISEIGRVIGGNWGKTAGLLVFLSPIWLLEFLKFESEAFALPILLLATYFVLQKETRHKILACFFVVVASFLWLGSLIYLIPFAFFYLPAFIPLAIAIPFYWHKVGAFLPNPAVNESAFLGAGFTFHWALLFGLLGLKDKRAWRLIPFLIFFGIAGFVSGKLGVHLAPFLAVCFALAIKRLVRLRSVVVGLTVVMVLASPFAILFLYEPTETQLSDWKQVVEEADGEIVCNDWPCGHAIEYFGGKPFAKAGGAWDYSKCPKNSIRLEC